MSIDMLEIIDVISNPFIFLLVGILIGIILVKVPTSVACSIATILPGINNKWGRFFLRGISWRLYRNASNAVVVKKIGECAPFLKMHFSSGIDGQIWLYNNDLTAFAQDGLFKELYEELVFSMDNIKLVKIIFDSRCKKNMLKIEKHIWEKMHERLVNNNHHKERSKIIKYMFLDNTVAKNNVEFQKFISDEAYVFYTRGSSIEAEDSTCVYRRYDGDMHLAEDDRVIIMSKRKRKPQDALNVFMPGKIIGTFVDIFSNTEDNKWEDFISLTKKGAYGNLQGL